MNITIQEAQTQVDEWIKKYGVRYFNELTNMALLMEEVGELARIMARKYGEQSPKKEETHASIADELSDILFVLLCIANQTQVDMNQAFEETLKKKTNRDKYRHINNEKLGNLSPMEEIN